MRNSRVVDRTIAAGVVASLFLFSAATPSFAATASDSVPEPSSSPSVSVPEPSPSPTVSSPEPPSSSRVSDAAIPTFTFDGECKVDSTLRVNLAGYAGDVSYQWGIYDSDTSPGYEWAPVPGETDQEIVILPSYYQRPSEFSSQDLAVRVTTPEGEQQLKCDVGLGPPPTVVTAPSVTGGMRVGTLAGADLGTWSHDVEVVQISWLVNGVVYLRRGTASFKIPGAQVGKSLAFEVTVSAIGYERATYRSVPRIIRDGGPSPFVVSSPPVITGEAITGSTLYAEGAVLTQRHRLSHTSGIATVCSWQVAPARNSSYVPRTSGRPSRT